MELEIIAKWLPPTGDSALYRSRHPNTWWVSPVVEFLAAVLFAVQSGNWQRSGGKGSKPKPWKRPREFSLKGMPKTRAELDARKRAQGEWLRKRREQKQAKSADT